jgi:hypothetical protein
MTGFHKAGGNQMRDFNFKDDTNTSAADIDAHNVDMRPLETPPEILTMDETPPEEPLRPFHIEQNEEESNNLPKIIGAVVVGLLIAGGGLYAYETSFAHHATVKTVAMNTTSAPTNNLAATTPPPSAAPDANAAPAATPEPAPPVKSAREIPAPKAELSKREPAQSLPAQQSASNAPGVGIGPTDDAAINAPMTLTPDNAPAPQSVSSSQTAQASAPAQTALQQPIVSPNVGSTSQPTASVAANQTPSVTAPSGDTSSATASQPAPTDQATQQPTQVQPAQVQPAPIQPSPVQ